MFFRLFPSRIPMRAINLQLAAVVAFVAIPVSAQEPVAKKGDDFDTKIRPLLEKHCYSCHAQVRPKGDFRLDKLSKDMGDHASREAWQNVLTRIKAGEMPPKDKPRPSEMETQLVTDWIAAGFKAADA